MSPRQTDFVGFQGADVDAHTNDADRRLTVAAVFAGWFRQLDFTHSESTHAEILDSLRARGLREVYQDVVTPLQAAIGGDPWSWSDFCRITRRRAQDARRRGLVRPDKQERKTGRRVAAQVATGDLFEGVAA